MLKNLMKLLFILCVSVFFMSSLGGSIVSQKEFMLNDIHVVSIIDWQNREIILHIRAPMPIETNFLPRARLLVQMNIQDHLPQIVRQAVESLIVDSRNTVKDISFNDSDVLVALEGLNGKLIKSTLSRDLQFLEETHQYPLYPLISSIFVEHEEPFMPPRRLGTGYLQNYTGLVIYAGRALDIWGENADPEYLRPAFFPKILNTRGETVLSAEMLEPGILIEEGMVLYTDSFEETDFIGRIGLNPLRIQAEAIFGTNRTDLILNSEIADRLLVSAHTRKLLMEGKILVILRSSSEESVE
jgi:hypothetical protein